MSEYGEFRPSNAAEHETTDHNNSRSWERKILEDLAFGVLKEQRRSRRWGYFFKSLTLVYAVAFLLLIMPSGDYSAVDGEHTALVDIVGPIAADADANADTVMAGIRKAFEDPNAKGLILRMNTPGGSPVQAGIINDELQRLEQSRPDFPVYALIQDVCASGGYYIAVAADEIYANKASIVGSIGVRMDSFGFTGTMDKLGVERRSLTAGKNKAFLDPFLPEKASDIAHAQQMLNTIHQQFIDVVKAGRGDRLDTSTPDLFSGLFWSGEQALKIGLIDGLANTSILAREKIGAEKIVDYTPRPDYLDRFAGKLGAAISQAVTTSANFKLN